MNNIASGHYITLTVIETLMAMRGSGKERRKGD
jgi:hypothetical protein